MLAFLTLIIVLYWILDICISPLFILFCTFNFMSMLYFYQVRKLLFNQQPKKVMKFLAIIILTFLFSIQPSLQFSFLLKITKFTITLTLPLDQSFTRIPDFTYALQSIQVQRSMYSLNCQIISATSRNMNLNFKLQSYFLGLLFDPVYIQVPILFIEGQWIEGGVITIPTGGSSTKVFTYAKQHRYNSPLSYSLSIFAVSAPFTYVINSMDSFSFSLTFANRPFSVGDYLLNFTITYLVVQKIFTAKQVFVPFTLINENIYNFVLEIDKSGSISPSSTNTFIGINELDYSGGVLSLFKLTLYNQIDPISSAPIMKIGFRPTITPLVKLRASFINFNILDEESKLCPSNYFITYRQPFINLPMSCNQCDKTCLTCASWEYDSNYTNSSFCVTCADYRYFTPYQTYKFGTCQCLKGLVDFPDGTCSTCQFNCLEFQVDFIDSNHRGAFLFTLTYSDVIHEIEFQKNLDVEVEGLLAQYTLSIINGGAYQIIIEPAYLKSCENNCKLIFRVKYPSSIRYYNNTYLTVQTRTKRLSNYYLGDVGSIKAVNSATQAISKIVTIAASTNFFQFFKFLFQLEQVIEIHKYINLELPIYFNQFVSSLEPFRFLDFTVFLPENYLEQLKNKLPSDLDTKGSPKIIYYEKGANFVKNIVKLMLSLFMIVLINLVTFGVFTLLALIPIQRIKRFFRRATKIIRLRWFISLSDYIQSAILPISVFGFFQFNYIIFKPSLFWIYACAFVMNSFVLLFSFFFLAIIMRKKIDKTKSISIFDKQKYNYTKLNRQNIEDMLQDCVLSRVAILFYCYGFLKKFLFGIILGNPMTGFIQVILMFILNIAHAAFLIYIFKKDRFKSKLKIISRTVSLLSVIALQSLIVAYNMIPMDPNFKVNIGYGCIWVSIVGSFGGLVDALIKFKDTFSQKIYEFEFVEEEEKERKQEQNQNVEPYFKNLFSHRFEAKLMNPKRVNEELLSEVSQSNNFQLYLNNQSSLVEGQGQGQRQQQYRQQLDVSGTTFKLVESQIEINGRSNNRENIQQDKQEGQKKQQGEKKRSEFSHKLIFQSLQEEDDGRNNNDDDAISKDSDIVPLDSSDKLLWEPIIGMIPQIRPNSRVKRLRQKNINSTANSFSTNYLSSEEDSLKNQNNKKSSGDSNSNSSYSSARRKNRTKQVKEKVISDQKNFRLVESIIEDPHKEQKQENCIDDDLKSNDSEIIPI